MLRASLTELLLALGLILLQQYLPHLPQLPDQKDVLPASTEGKDAYVTRVVDGDTLTVEIEGEVEKVRLIGIDTPETVDPRREIECFGHEASDALKKLVLQKNVRLESDPTQSNRDRYQRLLRYVFLPNEVFVNKKMIQDGYAFEYTFDKPYRYQEDFRKAEASARNAEKGLWREGTCPEK